MRFGKPGRSLPVGALIAVAVSLSACSSGPSQPTPLRGPSVDVSRAALAGGSPQMALQAANSILAKTPRDPKALLAKGDALTALGHIGQAEWSYRSALARSPHLVGAHVGLGRCLLAYSPAQAEAEFMAALQGDSENAAALNNLGVARDLQRNHAGAQEAYRKALVSDPDMIGAQANLALSLAMSGNGDEAERILSPYATDANASSKMRHDMAAVMAMGGKTQDAMNILSHDLKPEQARQAIDGYALAREGGK